MRCPRCGNNRCRIITETERHVGDYGILKGCCGYKIFGPIGLLCGLCGMEASTKTKNYWVCEDCGKKFKV